MKSATLAVSKCRGLAWCVGLLSSFQAVACSSSSDNKQTAPQTTPTAQANQWTMQGHDPGSTFVNPVEKKITTANAANLTEVWTADVDGTVEGSVAVVGNRVYALSTVAVYALDADTGEVIASDGTPHDGLWRQDGIVENPDYTLGGTGSIAYDNGLVYFINGSKGVMFALDAKTGSIKWKTQYEVHGAAAGWSSPVIVGNLVLIGNSSGVEITTPKDTDPKFRGSVVAFDKTSGELKWQTYTASETEDGASVWATPTVDVENKLVFAPTGNNYTAGGTGSDSVFGMELETGNVKWHQQSTTGDVFTIFNSRGNPDADYGGNALVFDYEVNGAKRKLVGVGQKSGAYHAFDRLTGDEVWTHEHLGPGTAATPQLFNCGAWGGDRIIIVANYATSTAAGSEPQNGDGGTSTLFALDPATGDIIWERGLPAFSWGPTTIVNGVAFVQTGNRVETVDIKDGTKLGELAVSVTVSATPVVVNGRVYFGSGVQWLGGVAKSETPNKIHAFALP
jgi:polyvinyl alcohol dehydrogenase (cytochrome)